MQHHWFALSTIETLKQLAATESGLTSREAAKRLKQYGPNALPEAKAESIVTIFFRQFQNPLIYVLLGSSLAIFLLGEVVDALIVLFVLLFNAVIGSIQEGRAQKTLQALKQFTKTSSTVLRDGEEQIIPDEQLVPGDIILLIEGQRIPADARVIETYNLTANEATLTGEVIPVHKLTEAVKQPTEPTAITPIGDQSTMIFKGTYVAAGRGKAVVVATGQQTEIGKIAQSIESINTDIPLKRSLERLTHQIVLVAGGVSLFLFGAGLALGHDVRQLFTTIVALAVSAIPEGLPIVLTLVLATGVWRMSKRNALVKKLNAVEALGQATVIAVDKTGTITRNELMVTDVYLPGATYQVTGVGYGKAGEILNGETKINLAKVPKELMRASYAALLNATAQIISQKQQWQVVGDPTEAALSVFAAKLGLNRDAIEQRGEIVADFPFDYERKFRASVYRHKKRDFISATGAPEAIMALCSLKGKERTEIETQLNQFLKAGCRVVAFAYKEESRATKVDIKNMPHLTFGGFFAMQDALHVETKQMVQRIQSAGLRIIMITGDHQVAARAIAVQAGIYRDGDTVVTGKEVELWSDEELIDHLEAITIFARVTPAHKQRIVQAYRTRGEVIAMTGDGVNDSPSLVAADLGMAMGKNGTEVAKEAADIVLLDDNLKSIVAAIEEGRSIYKTIKKVMSYLFATSTGEVLVVASFLLLGLPVPVTAAQIIWLNLVTDGFLDVALAMEPKSGNLLDRKWFKEDHRLVDSLMIKRIVLFATVMAIGTFWYVRQFHTAEPVKVSTIALTVMAAYQWFNAWSSRSRYSSAFSKSPFSNPYLIAATVVVIALQIVALNVPFMQKILHTQPLTLHEWLVAILVASSALWVEEIRKLLARILKRT